jgi:hypothetical protein
MEGVKAGLDQLNADMLRPADTPLRPIEDDGAPDVQTWREVLAPYLQARSSWLETPWLVSEFYFYRRVAQIFRYFQVGPYVRMSVCVHCVCVCCMSCVCCSSERQQQGRAWLSVRWVGGMLTSPPSRLSASRLADRQGPVRGAEAAGVGGVGGRHQGPGRKGR